MEDKKEKLLAFIGENVECNFDNLEWCTVMMDWCADFMSVYHSERENDKA